MRIVTGIIMLVGLLYGYIEYSSIMEAAESNIHEIYAVATGAMWFIFGYILARAIENIGEWLWHRYQEANPPEPERKGIDGRD